LVSVGVQITHVGKDLFILNVRIYKLKCALLLSQDDKSILFNSSEE